ncbi:hypothetical protein DM02DRAFT_645601 [Periconia macrospinosa]|uniref:X-Pro dipeptidyl-peptidase n=1 Tax=Periconia macrospinosa TaxID=97972 RepID=A0A2V1DCW2_9PLEO|nr:hypothetical protein DM02DRAFT_645601 [Periconia macrospinosa]
MGPIQSKTTPPYESMADRIVRVMEDLGDLEAYYKVNTSPTRYRRIQAFFEEEIASLKDVPFDDLDQEGKVDYILLRNYLRYQLNGLIRDAEQEAKVLPYLGGYFTVRLTRIIESRQAVDDVDGKQIASWLVECMEHIESVRKGIVDGKEKVDPVIALRATKTLAELKEHLVEWYSFYKDYDPLFTYWISDPYPKVDKALQNLIDTIKQVAIGIAPDDTDTIIGEPLGRARILEALQSEMIPYTPEQLIEIGHKEYAWCEAEMVAAASSLGFQNWRDALEHVKQQYVEPGKQPQLVRDQIKEATTYVQKHSLVTVPPLCAETIRTYMMSPSAQKINPFFLGGPEIIVSYPTSTMPHSQKLMSMRGNNLHFSRATVFHEMIPGHHLHMHYMARHRPYRQHFTTPFCIEGWAFYWEVVLYDADSWHKTPENKIGMLFWRMHRCARIIFSLKYHLGAMSAQECIELLVDWVGHERATAEGEVRRSIMGDYGPLYQAGYMLGGLQLWALRKELVGNNGEGEGKMGEKAFHDAFLRSNQMPVELFRALVKGEVLEREGESSWEFYEGLE